MPYRDSRQEVIDRREQYLLPQSLARRANWPEWAREAVGRESGHTALLHIEARNEFRCAAHHDHTICCARRFAYLGMPNDALDGDRKTCIKPRKSRGTETGGHYYLTEPRIGAVNAPDPATIRGLINRHIRDPEVRKRKWSGWFVLYNYLWMITGRDMIEATNGELGFVAVIDTDTLPELARVERSPYGPEVFMYDADVRPELVVPVARSDMSPFTIVIEKPGLTRQEAQSIYREASENLVETRDRYPGLLMPLNSDRCWPIPLDPFRPLSASVHP